MIVVKDSSPVACWRGAGSKASTRRRWQARNVGEAPPLCHGKRARMATAVRILDYAVTFEFTDRPPLTHRGTVAGSRETTVVSQALRNAKAALRPVRWSSAVVLLTGVSDNGEPA